MVVTTFVFQHEPHLNIFMLSVQDQQLTFTLRDDICSLKLIFTVLFKIYN